MDLDSIIKEVFSKPTHVCWPSWNTESYEASIYVKNWPYKKERYEKVKLTEGKKFQFQIKEGKYCVGYFKQEKPQPCDKVEKTKESQCKECGSKQITHHCAPCTGEKCINPIARDTYCQNPFVCYLVGFLPDIIKVGVALEERYERRVFEQGADLTTIITEASDGMKAKKIEREIKEKLGVADRIMRKRKIEAVYKEKRLKELKKQISDTREKIKKDLEIPLSELQIMNLHKVANYPKTTSKPFKIDLKEGKVIEGEILGIKGPHLFFKNKSIYYFDLWKDLMGWVVNKTEKHMRTQSKLKKKV